MRDIELNKKQQIVGWIMILLISTVIIHAILSANTNLSIKIPLLSYFLILIFGFPLVYALRDEKK